MTERKWLQERNSTVITARNASISCIDRVVTLLNKWGVEWENMKGGAYLVGIFKLLFPAIFHSSTVVL